MSIDFDSAALQTQQDEDEYDQEDYAREQEVTHTHSLPTLLCSLIMHNVFGHVGMLALL